MVMFNKSVSGNTTPFGSNEFLASTHGTQYAGYTFAASTLPSETIDGHVVKVLRRGEVLAKITSGPESGKVGPFQAGVTDGRQTAANIVGVNDSFRPWQFEHGDDQVSALYIGTVDQALCYERDAAGARITLTNTTIDAMRGTKGLDITAK